MDQSAICLDAKTARPSAARPWLASLAKPPRRRSATPQAALATPQAAPASKTSPAPKILFVTTEMADFVKVGGLGEVSASLPRAMREISEVRVLLPGYPSVMAGLALNVVAEIAGSAGLPAWTLKAGRTADGLMIYVVDCPQFFARSGNPYGLAAGRDFDDNARRFARLSLAAAEIAAGEADPNWRPDILHANDWPSALSLGYAKWKDAPAKGVFTIHNLAYQGLFPRETLNDLAIPDHAFAIDGVEFHGQLSFLKAGIYYASQVTTVSETYAREITSEAMGCGLHGLLADRAEAGRLTGILNGIDPEWNDPKSGMSLMRWKKMHANEIRRQFRLSAGSGPLFAIISRLVHQKGIDLSLKAAEHIVAEGGQLVVTGQGEARFEREIERLAQRHEGAVAAHIGYDEAEARKIFAASDFLLMPSRFEPCGLSQMYAQKSGALPIAFRTGGLADTIEHGRSGFLFSAYTAAGLSHAIGSAMALFRHERPTIQRMRRYASTRHYDWTRSARAYLALYQSA